MKKYIFTLLTLLLVMPVIVLADNPKVLTLDTENNDNKVNFSGTVEAGSYAVMCKLYDADNHEKDMLSVAVNGGAFAGSFTVTTAGDYKVACANYEGGTIKSDTTSVDEVAPIVTTYTVRFDTDGGSPITDVVVDAGEKVAQPADPNKDGFVFDGWYEDATLTTLFDFNTPITNDTMLYVKWREVVAPVVVHTIYLGEGGIYVVDFYTTDGENQGPIGAPINTSAMYFVPGGDQMVLMAEPDDGYEFKGWYSVHEVDTDGHGNMEWRLDERLSTERTYRFVPTGTPYIAPVFESNVIIHRVIFETNCEDHIDDVEVEHDGVVVEPRRPEREGFNFVGWYEDETLTTEFDFNTRITDEVTLYAKWEEESHDDWVPYDLPDDNGNSISFSAEEGHEFSFAILDLAKITDEELLELTGGEVSREQFNEALGVLKEAVSDEGTFVAIYEIIVVDENDVEKHRGPFIIRINKTEEMKDFDSFKLLYVDTDNNFEVLETVLLTDKGDYLEGELEHLSSYVLVGNASTPTTNNPQTLDNIYIWVSALMISIAGLVITFVAQKLQKKKVK